MCSRYTECSALHLHISHCAPFICHIWLALISPDRLHTPPKPVVVCHKSHPFHQNLSMHASTLKQTQRPVTTHFRVISPLIYPGFHGYVVYATGGKTTENDGKWEKDINAGINSLVVQTPELLEPHYILKYFYSLFFSTVKQRCKNQS